MNHLDRLAAGSRLSFMSHKEVEIYQKVLSVCADCKTNCYLNTGVVSLSVSVSVRACACVFSHCNLKIPCFNPTPVKPVS